MTEDREEDHVAEVPQSCRACCLQPEFPIQLGPSKSGFLQRDLHGDAAWSKDECFWAACVYFQPRGTLSATFAEWHWMTCNSSLPLDDSTATHIYKETSILLWVKNSWRNRFQEFRISPMARREDMKFLCPTESLDFIIQCKLGKELAWEWTGLSCKNSVLLSRTKSLMHNWKLCIWQFLSLYK